MDSITDRLIDNPTSLLDLYSVYHLGKKGERLPFDPYQMRIVHLTTQQKPIVHIDTLVYSGEEGDLELYKLNNLGGLNIGGGYDGSIVAINMKVTDSKTVRKKVLGLPIRKSTEEQWDRTAEIFLYAEGQPFKGEYHGVIVLDGRDLKRPNVPKVLDILTQKLFGYELSAQTSLRPLK